MCLIHNPKCIPYNSNWQDISSSSQTVISPGIDVPTAKSALKIPKDVQSAFFRCIARNVRGEDSHVMSFFSSGELTLCSIMNYLLTESEVLIGKNEILLY